MRILLYIAFLLIGKWVAAQDGKPKINWFTFADETHSPTKATVYSTVIPGLGQAYNHKYWKVPVVYAAMGASTYFMLNQRKQMRAMNTNFTSRYADSDLSNDPSSRELADRDNLRRGRDIGILVTTGLYALQIVDAAVDAHFYKIDINQDLNVQMHSPTRFLNFCYQF